MNHRITLLVAGIAVLAGCTQPPQDAQPVTDHPAPPPPGETELVRVLNSPPLQDDTRRLKQESAEFRHVMVQAGDVAGSSLPVSRIPPIEPWQSPGTETYREQYERPDDHGVVRVSDLPVSTFSIDVDTGAYANTRRWLNQGQLPPTDAVRIEELVNYFDYNYRSPDSRDAPFSVHTEIAVTPWNPRSHLLRIGLKGYDIPRADLPPANLVFLLDVSGSMNAPDKLPLLEQAMRLLTRSLDAEDRVAIVVYAGASGVVLPPTAGNDHAAVNGALDRLSAGGSTNGAAGIATAYALARQNFTENGINRVILATDGDFNVGLASHDELVDMITRQRKAGIALTTLGFGRGNYNDHLLEQLANVGNGNHAYIDRLSEARKVLDQELGATLMTIAGDVKIQLEFNPATVSEYRLIGYENRVLDEADFNNDQVDAGEIGAGHRVTALYEITLAGTHPGRLPARRYGQAPATPAVRHGDELAHLRIRYKAPGIDTSRLIEQVVHTHELRDMDATSDDFRFAAAVAAFGQRLRGGEWLDGYDWPDIAQLARGARGDDPWGHRSEFLQLVGLAESLDEPRRVSQAGLER